MDMLQCPDLAVPAHVMQHVVRVESSFNPYAIGVVGGRLVRQPRNLPEAVATAKMLESRDVNFSLGLSQVNRHNLSRYGLTNYAAAFQACPNLRAGSRILAECASRSGGDWGKAFSCYYSGNFVTGYRHGYVQKVFASMGRAAAEPAGAIPLAVAPRVRARSATAHGRPAAAGQWQQRIVGPSPAPDAVPTTRDAAATRVGAIPTNTTLASPGTAPPDDAIVVLDPAGGPPRLQPSTTPPVPPAAPRPAVDTAFVF